MAVQCPTCFKVNPASAAYCYYDGRALSQLGPRGPLGRGTLPLPLQFSFPDGQGCTTFNQLVLACDRRWNEARNNLLNGTWESYFGLIGRPDLAALARQSARETDADMGLCRLLEGLPADPEALRPPKLALPSPTEDLGALEPGKDHHLKCVIENQGMLLLCGAAATDCDWLVFTDGHGATSSKLFQTRDTHTLSVRVVGKKVRAGIKPLEGQIVIDTNGGCQTVAVRATVPIRPFPRGRGIGTVLAGATSPRELAVKAKARPKEAAVLFEQGAVKAWYESNGWTYPVQGSQARGKGAVQQFFEALGLIRAPHLEIDTERIDCRGEAGQRVVKKVVVRTAEAKFVNVEAHSNQRWVKVLPAKSEGNSVTIPLCIEVPRRRGETLQAIVTFRGNGQQQFLVPVTLTVAGITREQEKQKERRGRLLEWALGGVGLLVFLAIGSPIAYHLYQSIKPPAVENPPREGEGANPQDGPGVPADVWWDKFPDSNLAASYSQLKEKAGDNRPVVEGLAVPADARREDGYTQLAAKLPQLAHNPEAREPLGQFVAGCCVYEPPPHFVIKPLLHGLAAQFPQKDHPFPQEDKGSEVVELADFWLQVACEVINHKPVHPGRREALTSVLNEVLGCDLDQDGSPDEIKEKLAKAVAEQCYHSMALTGKQSPDRALAIRDALNLKFKLTPEFRLQDDVKLLEKVLEVGLPKDHDLWPTLKPIFMACVESDDRNAVLRVVDLYGNAELGLALRMELAVKATNVKWKKMVDDQTKDHRARAKAIRDRIMAQAAADKSSRADWEK